MQKNEFFLKNKKGNLLKSMIGDGRWEMGMKQTASQRKNAIVTQIQAIVFWYTQQTAKSLLNAIVKLKKKYGSLNVLGPYVAKPRF